MSSRVRFAMRRVSRTGAAAVLVLLGAAVAAAKNPPKADRIFIKGAVWTGDPSKPRAEALAVRGTRIIAVGSSIEIARLSGQHTEAVDLRGKFVLPGFNDSHSHFLVVETADLAGSGSVAEMQRRIAEFAKRHPESVWVQGRGWGYGDFGGAEPNRKLLDAVVPERPAVLTDRDGHAVWCNTRALELAEVTKGTPDPPNGVIVRDKWRRHWAPQGVRWSSCSGSSRRRTTRSCTGH